MTLPRTGSKCLHLILQIVNFLLQMKWRKMNVYTSSIWPHPISNFTFCLILVIRWVTQRFWGCHWLNCIVWKYSHFLSNVWKLWRTGLAKAVNKLEREKYHVVRFNVAHIASESRIIKRSLFCFYQPPPQHSTSTGNPSLRI